MASFRSRCCKLLQGTQHRKVHCVLSTSSQQIVSVMDNNLTFLFSFSEKYFLSHKYRKIPKISPGAYIFQRPFLRGLFLEGLIFGGAYIRREICVSKSIGLAL